MMPVPPIVVVDDDVDHALIARLVLRQIAPDADVTVMTDPRDLHARLIASQPGTLVLIDRMLDGSDGAAMVPALRMARPDVSVVLMSAALSDADRDRALALGAHAAVEKPGSMRAWRELLASILEGQALRASSRAA